MESDDEWNENPRCECRRPDLNRTWSDNGEDPRGQSKGEATNDPRRRCADSKRGTQFDDSEEGDHEDQCPPQSLCHPGGQSRRVSKPEKRTHRKQVAVRLVLHLPEGAVRIPQMHGASQKSAGVEHEVGFRVAYYPTRLLYEGNRHENQTACDLSLIHIS